VALMMEPMTMAGALAGVLLNKVLPAWLITLLLIAILGHTTYRTLSRGLSDWHKEAAAAAVISAKPEVATGLLQSDPEQAPKEAAPTDPLVETRLMSRRNCLDVAILVLALSVCTAVSRLRGSNRFNSVLHVRCGSLEYWSLTLMQLGFLLVISYGIRSILLRRHDERMAAGFAFLVDDVHWTPRSAIVYPSLCAIAGLCAGLFGIGGGIIKGPLMLEMGMLPAVSSATSAFMILFTSAAATCQFALMGDLRPNYAMALGLAGFLGTIVGQLVLNALIKRFGRPSLIVLIIAFVIGASTIMGVTGVLGLHQDLREGKSQGFRPLCSSGLIE